MFVSKRVALLPVIALISAPAMAAETVTYVYDELGRLIQASTAGPVSNGQVVATTYDPAGNRTNQSVSGLPDPNQPPRFSIGGASATEGGTLTFTVTLNKAHSASASVQYATSSNTATSPADFAAANGALILAAGQTQATFAVNTSNDSDVEDNETFNVVLSNPTGGLTIANATAVGTIVDDDAPLSATFSVSDASANEGDELVFVISKNGNTSVAHSVSWSTASSSALAGSDFSSASGTLTFQPSETSKSVSVPTINDTTEEPNETLLLNLSGATAGATISDTQGLGTIIDNDVTLPPPSFSISTPANVTEGGTFSYAVTKSGNTNSAFSVSYSTANGSAAAPGDYASTSGTLTFQSNENVKYISVATVDDNVIESAETVLVNLASPTGGATINSSRSVGTITDNDQPIVITDDNLNVLPAHQAIYSCEIADIPELSLYYEACWLTSNWVMVYRSLGQGPGNNLPPLDPGYMRPAPIRLEVLPNYYGTGVAP